MLSVKTLMRSSLASIALLCLVVQLSPEHVSRVIDGDTFVLYHVGVPAEERVRILGIDTPERGKPNSQEAAQFTTRWLHQGAFTLTTCKRDSFGRLLGSVDRRGEFLGAQLIGAGLATVWRK